MYQAILNCSLHVSKIGAIHQLLFFYPRTKLKRVVLILKLILNSFGLMKPKVLDYVYMNVMNEAYSIQRIKLRSEVCYAPDDKTFVLEKGCEPVVD